jgi:hypothetical protein
MWAAATLSLAAGSADAAGPWKGRIVDAETGQPLAGVIVLASWWRRSPGAVHERREFHEAHEVVTDADGRFVVPAVPTSATSPFARVQGPRVIIFKGGYGQWQFRGEPPLRGSDAEQRSDWLEEAWKRFAREGIVIELPPLKTREERRDFRGMARPDPDIPGAKIGALTRALDAEEEWLRMQRPPR